MKLTSARVLVTGATGGIGSALARELVRRGASVLLSGRDASALADLADELSAYKDRVAVAPADLAVAADRERLCRVAARAFGGINVLINNAGISRFGLFQATTDGDIDRLLDINVAAPMHLTRALLATLLRQPSAAIVNVGSVFGTIGFAGQAVYSASKFALRGFSEALRRELADTSVRVLDVAPRATRTTMNSAAVDRLNAELGNTADAPETVASAICAALTHDRARSVLGWPERFYAKLNALLPAIVDRALAGQLAAVKSHASSEQPRSRPLTGDTVTLEPDSLEISS